MQFKPPKPHDDQEKIRSDVAHDVRVGGKAKVSLGGMSAAVVEVTGIGLDGITTKDAKGRAYRFVWQHVHGPAGADEKLDDAKAAASPINDEPMTKALTGDYQPADDARIIATVNAALAPILSAMAAMQQNHQQALDRFAGLVAAAIGKPLPAINLQMPEAAPANIQVDVHVPEQPAPVINFAPAVSVITPEQQQISIVSMPERRTEAVVERDKDGNLKSSVQIEKDSA